VNVNVDIVGLPDLVRAWQGAPELVEAELHAATLEATLLGCPQVVAARTNRLTAALLRRMVKVDTLTMPNLIAGEAVVPEFLQEDARAERIAEAVLALVRGPAREEQLERLRSVREQLSQGGAAKRAAEIASEMIGGRLPA